MDWWRAHHGLPYDPKLAVVAKRCHMARGKVLAVWVAVLDYASQRETRGTVSGVSAEEIGVSLEFPVRVVESILQGFRDLEMINGDLLTAWEKRQFSDCSTERVRRCRERKKRQVTPETVVERPDTEQIQSRAEQSVSHTLRTAFQFEPWFQKIWEAHPIPGKPQMAQQYLTEYLAEGRIIAAKFERAHALWVAHWKTHPKDTPPTLETFVTGYWWAKDPPKPARQSREAKLDEVLGKVSD